MMLYETIDCFGDMREREARRVRVERSRATVSASRGMRANGEWWGNWQRIGVSPLSLCGAIGTPPYPVRTSVARAVVALQGIFFAV
jgi:hypothetical protein